MFVDEETGLIYYFKYDETETDRLHVEVRGASVESAIATHRSGNSVVWNPERRRWETIGDEFGVYWALYHEQAGHIFVISCFRLEES